MLFRDIAKGIQMKTKLKQSGVTLHELLVAMSISTILVSMAVPSYSQFMSKRRLSGASNLISMYFDDIKMHSIKRNEFISISYQISEDGNQWCIGSVLGQDNSCDCMAEPNQCQIDSNVSSISNTTYPEFDQIKPTFTGGTMTFDPVRGILTNPADALNMQIQHKSEDFQVNISVNATGTVRKCTPASHELIGYPACI